MQKPKEKALKKNWRLRQLTQRTRPTQRVCQLSGQFTLSTKKAHEKAQGRAQHKHRAKRVIKPLFSLSPGVRTQRKVSVKSKVPQAYKKSRKKGKTRRIAKLFIKDIQSLSIFNMGNPPSLAIPHLFSFSHPNLFFIHISM